MKDGEEKTRWLQCGILLKTDKGLRLKLDALPTNMGEGWFNVFTDDAPQNRGAATPVEPKTDDDIPW
jgi:hypothetical protein